MLLTPGTCDYVTFYGRTIIVNVIWNLLFYVSFCCFVGVEEDGV
jgi:hypothetical protein